MNTYEIKKLLKASKHEQAANEFLFQTKAEIKADFKRIGKHFADDQDERPIYEITISRGKRNFTFDFGDSIAHLEEAQKHDKPIETLQGETPTNYNILACLQKYDVGNFENFCSEFGYDSDSRKAEKIYKAVKNEFQNLQTLFSDDEMEVLQEIN